MSEYVYRQVQKQLDQYCIGCGLCVPSCSENALSLVVKPEEEHHAPTKTLHELLTFEAERRLQRKLEKKQVVDFGFD